MAHNKLKNGGKCYFSDFDSTSFLSEFFVQAVSILLVSFILSHFHMSNGGVRTLIFFESGFKPVSQILNPDPVPTRFKQADSCLSPVK